MFAFREESEPTATLAAPPKTNDGKQGCCKTQIKNRTRYSASKHNKNSQSAEVQNIVACEQNNSTICYQ